MAAITNATTATVIAPIKLNEQLERLTRLAVQRPYIWQFVAYVPAMLVNTDRYESPKWARLSASAAHTETDEVASAEVTPSVEAITTAEYAKASFLGDRAKRLATQDLLAVAVDLVVDACQLKIDTDVLTLAASMSNSQGSNATVNTVANWNSAVSAFRAQAKYSMNKPVAVLSSSAMRDMAEDAVTSAAAIYGSMFGQQFQDAVSGPNQGALGAGGQMRELTGVILLETDGVVAGDTTGKSNFIVHVGENEHALAVPMGKMISLEPGRVPERIGEWIVASHEHGAGIVDQARALRFITRA